MCPSDSRELSTQRRVGQISQNSTDRNHIIQYSQFITYKVKYLKLFFFPFNLEDYGIKSKNIGVLHKYIFITETSII